MFRVVHKHLFNYVRYYEILSGLHSGFISRDSTVNHLVDTYNTFSKSLDEGKEVPAVFSDISKAFHRVWYRQGSHKLWKSWKTWKITKKVPCIEKSWNLKKKRIIMEKLWNFEK